MSTRGRGKKSKTPEKTPTTGTRHSSRIQKLVTPEAMDVSSELSNSAEKFLSLKETVKNLPAFYEELKLPKALYDLAASIEKSVKGKVLGNKDVQKNFVEVQEIFQGWATPVTTPTKGHESKNRSHKRKRSDVQNGDETMKSTEFIELQECAKKLKEENEDLCKQLAERPILAKEKVKDDIIKTLRDNNLKLEQEFNSKKMSLQDIEKGGKIEIEKKEREIEFVKHKLEKAKQEIIELKKTIKETMTEDKYDGQDLKDVEEKRQNQKDTQSKEQEDEKDITQKLTDANLEITELKEKLQKTEMILKAEENVHMDTKIEEKRSKEKQQQLKEELQFEKDTLAKAQIEIQKKNEELESLSNELITSSDFNERKSRECESLKDQFVQMQKELKQKNEELDDLRNRLSSLSASKLDGDPNITDLGDPNRPLKLVERYQQLYDNLWTDIFDELTDSYHDVDNSAEREKMAAMEIMSIFERVLQFCKHLVEDQEKTIISSLTCCSEENLYAVNSSIDISTIRNIRRSIAQKVLPSIVELYIRQNEQEFTGLMKDFAEECIAICWLTQVQDPPMAFEFNYDHGVQLDKDLMREFTVSGDIVDYVVWPTMRLTSDGPVMVKSVVQPIKKKR
ncbi:protein BCAP-like [Mytilus edulis]|uniref:protein BCAP-like n=1 Tax=Mytilus edulis TaxID=6550 RepID=UPI0039F0244C